MARPKLELIPIRGAARAEETTTLDVLVRVTPPLPEIHFERPPLNLGLVLDHSGSMSAARKMGFAREAAAFAVGQLLPTDRVSITIFDSWVTTLAANAPAIDKGGLARLIGQVVPRGGTNLHAGWKEGAAQVEGNLLASGVNRVILLSDGLANEGVTEPDVIAGEAKGHAARGVGTTTMGLGDDYNEDLLQAMAEAGDGNYYYIESAVQLTDVFQTELKGLMANVGRMVSLGLEPSEGVSAVDVLNDLDRNSRGRLMLPNLTVGMPTSVIVRLKVPPLAREAEVCRFRLAWDEPAGGPRQTLHASLTLGSCPAAEWEAQPVDLEVAELVAVLMANRAKREAILAHDRNDEGQTRALLGEAMHCFAELRRSPVTDQELAEIAELGTHLSRGERAKFRKHGSEQVFRKKRGQES